MQHLQGAFWLLVSALLCILGGGLFLEARPNRDPGQRQIAQTGLVSPAAT